MEDDGKEHDSPCGYLLSSVWSAELEWKRGGKALILTRGYGNDEDIMLKQVRSCFVCVCPSGLGLQSL